MENSGTWNKIGRKHYEHIDGVQVKYDCNRWGWEVIGTGLLFSALWVAKHYAEKGGR